MCNHCEEKEVITIDEARQLSMQLRDPYLLAGLDFFEQSDNQDVKINLPEGNLTYEIIDHIIYILPTDNEGERNWIPDRMDLTFWVWKTTRGTLIKRLMNLYHKTCKGEIPQNVITKIGALTGEAVKSQSFNVMTKKEIDWNRGRYSDDGSCYWKEYVEAKWALNQLGLGGAVDRNKNEVFFRAIILNDKSRCWAVWMNQRWILFNAYGDVLLTFARVFATALGGAYYRASTLKGADSTIMYFNGKNEGGRRVPTGMVVGSRWGDESFDVTRLDWEKYSKRWSDTHEDDKIRKCYACGEDIDDYEEDGAELNGYHYHSNCLHYCDLCDENYSGYAEECWTVFVDRQRIVRLRHHEGCSNCIGDIEGAVTNYNRISAVEGLSVDDLAHATVMALKSRVGEDYFDNELAAFFNNEQLTGEVEEETTEENQ